MQNQKQKALVIKEFKKPPIYQDTDIPQPGPTQVQIKLIASTINPSDRITIEGGYWRTEPNFVGGHEGFGQIIKGGNAEGQKLVGKKVSFTTGNGTWAQYTVANIQNVWEVDNDVPIQSAASGIVNPVTVIGFIETYRKWSNRGLTGKGLINSAAASALGRMLNKYCQKENIPLLNIVRRKQQVKILQEEGAKHIINTSDQNWVQQYKQALKINEFNVLFDAIGGGDISDKLISHLPSGGQAYIYGKLSSDPLTISKPIIFSGGAIVTNWLLFEWLPTVSKEEIKVIKKKLPQLLKKQLSTNSIKKLKLEQVPQLFKEAQKRATQGKFTIII